MGQLCSGGDTSGSGGTQRAGLKKGGTRSDADQLKMERRASIKGPMTKYMLRFDKVQEVYSMVEKNFTAANATNDKSKSKFHSKVACTSILSILDALGVPQFDNLESELISEHFKIAGNTNIDFKSFLIGVGNLVWKQGVKRVDVTTSEINYGAKIMITGAVETIEPGSPADKAGIKVGDKVEEINGHAVKNGGAKYKISLENAINDQSIDGTKTAKIVFQRDLATELGAVSSNMENWTDLKDGFGTVEAMFEDIDADSGGTIDFDEFCAAFNQCSGISDKERVKTRLRELDFDGNNEIDRDEFIFGISAWVGFADDEELDSDREFESG